MKVTFIVADTFGTYIALRYENEGKPYARRTVTLNLTPEQENAIGLRVTGTEGGQVWREEILSCFVENESK